MRWVFLNQEFIQADKASIPIHDRGFLFGDGIFTTAKVENGQVIHWGRHYDRLLQQCQALNISPPSIDLLTIETLIARNQAQEGIWKLKVVITGGSDPRLSLPSRSFGTLLITLERYQMPTGKAIVCLYPYPIETPAASWKTLSYLHRLMVKQYALEKGADDAVVCTADGWVLETAFSNLIWKEGNETAAPPLTLPLLAGTRLASLEIGREERITYAQLQEKESVYLCNAMCVQPCLCLE